MTASYEEVVWRVLCQVCHLVKTAWQFINIKGAVSPVGVTVVLQDTDKLFL